MTGLYDIVRPLPNREIVRQFITEHFVGETAEFREILNWVVDAFVKEARRDIIYKQYVRKEIDIDSIGESETFTIVVIKTDICRYTARTFVSEYQQKQPTPGTEVQMSFTDGGPLSTIAEFVLNEWYIGPRACLKIDHWVMFDNLEDVCKLSLNCRVFISKDRIVRRRHE